MMSIQRARISERYEVVFSEHCEYRYVWRWRWDDRPLLLVAGLIPSRADATQIDATVRKCIAIAMAPHKEVGPRYAGGYGGLVVVNMYAKWPTPNHMRANLVQFFDLVGAENDRHICIEARKVRQSQGTIVAAWGDSGWSRHGRMLSLLGDECEQVWCFGTAKRSSRTTVGFPNHAALRDTPAKSVVLKHF